MAIDKQTELAPALALKLAPQIGEDLVRALLDAPQITWLLHDRAGSSWSDRKEASFLFSVQQRCGSLRRRDCARGALARRLAFYSRSLRRRGLWRHAPRRLGGTLFPRD